MIAVVAVTQAILFAKFTTKLEGENTMTRWRILKTTDQYREIVNLDTRQVRKVMLASNKQWQYLETLRQKHAKAGSYKPLKHRPTIFGAKKKIDKYLEKEKQQALL